MTSIHDDQQAIARLGRHFAELSEEFSRADDPSIDLDKVIRLAARAVPGAEACGLTLKRQRHAPRSLSRSDPVVARVDTIQFETKQGPFQPSDPGGSVELSGDVEVDARWPAFGPRCLQETGVRSVLSLRLPLAKGDHAALTFYARRADAFGDTALAVASSFVPFAALAVEQRLRTQDAANFDRALSSSRQIGAAVGILMARNLLTAAQAFEQLSRASQHLNRKLHDVAAEVEETGELPSTPATSGRRRLPPPAEPAPEPEPVPGAHPGLHRAKAGSNDARR